jgi:hypothetical protein
MYPLYLRVNSFFSKNSIEFRLHLGHLKLSTTISLINQPIITKSLNFGPYIKPHNSTQYIYIYIYILRVSLI